MHDSNHPFLHALLVESSEPFNETERKLALDVVGEFCKQLDIQNDNSKEENLHTDETQNQTDNTSSSSCCSIFMKQEDIKQAQSNLFPVEGSDEEPINSFKECDGDVMFSYEQLKEKLSITESVEANKKTFKCDSKALEDFKKEHPTFTCKIQ